MRAAVEDHEEVKKRLFLGRINGRQGADLASSGIWEAGACPLLDDQLLSTRHRLISSCAGGSAGGWGTAYRTRSFWRALGANGRFPAFTGGGNRSRAVLREEFPALERTVRRLANAACHEASAIRKTQPGTCHPPRTESVSPSGCSNRSRNQCRAILSGSADLFKRRAALSISAVPNCTGCTSYCLRSYG